MEKEQLRIVAFDRKYRLEEWNKKKKTWETMDGYSYLPFTPRKWHRNIPRILLHIFLSIAPTILSLIRQNISEFVIIMLVINAFVQGVCLVLILKEIK